MELQKKSELTAGGLSYVINTELAGAEAPVIETKILSSEGGVVHKTSQDISSLKPIFQNSQKVFERLEAQHEAVLERLRQGRLSEVKNASSGASPVDPESDALEHAVGLLGQGNFEKATASLRAVLETFPNCIEAREFLEIAYKASSDARLPVDVVSALKRGTEAFTDGKQRDAIESWKQCLIEEPGNRVLQILVLLSTTWSQRRRESYAQQVLSADGTLMAEARPEEAEALFLVAQSVYGDAAPPKPVAATGAVAVAPSPPVEAEASPGVDTQPVTRNEATPQGAAEPAPTRAATPAPTPAPAAPVTPAPSIPPRKPTALPPSPSASASTRKQSPEAPKPVAPAPSPSAARPAAPGRRPPMGRARHRSPWPIVGAVGGVLVLSVVIAIWLLSGGGNVPPDRLERAANLIGSGQYAQAIDAYDGILAEFGDHAEIYLGRGRARLASGSTAAGLEDLERAHTMDPEASAIAEEIGDVLYSQSDYPQAIAYYEKAYARGGGGAEGRYRLAVSLVQQNRADDALPHLTAAIQSNPAHGEAQFLLGQLLNANGRHAEAEQALRAAEPHVEAGSDFLAQLSVALLEQGKLDEAEESARNFIRSYANDPRARALLGEVYLRREQYEPARAQLIQALRTDPREPRAQVALGRTWLAIGKSRGDAQDLAKARQLLESASGVHEGNRLLALGQVALAEGDAVAAAQLLNRALGEGAPPLAVHLSLAEAKATGEDLVGAAEELQRAAGLASEDPAIALSLAIVYSQLSETSRASEQFLKTLQSVGLLTPPVADSGPVVLPKPLVPLPQRFNVNRAIRDAYQGALQLMENDPTATELKTLAESATFVLREQG